MFKIIVIVITLLYPFLVYKGLAYFSIREMCLALLVVITARFLITIKEHTTKNYISFAVVAVLLLFSALSEQTIGMLLYPVVINGVLAVTFIYSLFYATPVIEKLARLQDPNLPSKAIAYTRKVTKVWAAFFLVNGSIACFTVLADDLALWTLYNGLISYILMGLLFAGEFIVRKKVQKQDVS